MRKFLFPSLAVVPLLLVACTGGGGGAMHTHYVRFEPFGPASDSPMAVWFVGDELLTSPGNGTIARLTPDGETPFVDDALDLAVADDGRIFVATASGLLVFDSIDAESSVVTEEVFQAIAVQGTTVHALQGDLRFRWMISSDAGETWETRAEDLLPGEFGAETASAHFDYVGEDAIVGTISGDGDFGYNFFYIEQQYVLGAGDVIPVLDTTPTERFPLPGVSPGGRRVFAISTSEAVRGEDVTDTRAPAANIAMSSDYHLGDTVDTFERVYAAGLGETLMGADPSDLPLAVDPQGRVLYHSRTFYVTPPRLMRTTASIDEDLSNEVLAGPRCNQRETIEGSFESGSSEVTIENATNEPFVIVPMDNQARYHPELTTDPATGFTTLNLLPPGESQVVRLDPEQPWMALTADERCLGLFIAGDDDSEETVEAP